MGCGRELGRCDLVWGGFGMAVVLFCGLVWIGDERRWRMEEGDV